MFLLSWGQNIGTSRGIWPQGAQSAERPQCFCFPETNIEFLFKSYFNPKTIEFLLKSYSIPIGTLFKFYWIPFKLFILNSYWDPIQILLESYSNPIEFLILLNSYSNPIQILLEPYSSNHSGIPF